MTVSKTDKPKLMQLFENLLWCNSPCNWILNTAYFHSTLFISFIIEKSSDPPFQQKIRRNITLNAIKSRSEDLHGLAEDFMDEIKTSVNKL
jgi:hypothetical protein